MPTIQLPLAYDPAHPTTTIYNLKTLLEALAVPIIGRASYIGMMINPNSPAGSIWIEYGRKPSGATNPNDAGVNQVETATLIETVPGTLTAGNIPVTVTAVGMSNSPKTIQVAVATNDSQNTVAGKIRTALAADADVAAFFTVSGATNAIILTTLVMAANDTTMNVGIADTNSLGITAAPTSTNTTAGVANGSYGVDLSALTNAQWGIAFQGNTVLPENIWLAAQVANSFVNVFVIQA